MSTSKRGRGLRVYTTPNAFVHALLQLGDFLLKMEVMNCGRQVTNKLLSLLVLLLLLLLFDRSLPGHKNTTVCIIYILFCSHCYVKGVLSSYFVVHTPVLQYFV